MRKKGRIKNIKRNYGTLEDISDKKEYNFFIFPDMMRNGKDIRLNKLVTFKTKNIQIRDGKGIVAYDLKDEGNEEKEKYRLKKVDSNDMIYSDYHYYVFKEFFSTDENRVIQELINIDKKFKLFIVKWVLFLEESIKRTINEITIKNTVNSKEIFNYLLNISETKNIVTKRFKFIKSKYAFRKEFEYIEITRSKSDRNDFDIIDCPLPLFLEVLTLDELGKIVKNIIKMDKVNNDSDNNFKFISYTIQLLSELSVIRNAAAHGNPLIPLLFEQSYNINEKYNLSSPFPSWNMGEDVEKWELFEFIRFTTRQLTKLGIAPLWAGGLQYTGLLISKYILINAVRRSFFSFFYIMICYFEYIGDDDEVEFWKDLKPYLGAIFSEEINSDKNLLGLYPNKKNSVINKFFLLLYPLISYRTSENYGNFKPVLEACIHIKKSAENE